MRHHGPFHLWNATELGQAPTAGREYVRGYQDGRYAALFQFNAVEQTARAATPSVSVRENDGVAAFHTLPFIGAHEIRHVVIPTNDVS